MAVTELGFSPGTNFVALDQPYFGLVPDPETGDYADPPAHSIQKDWADWCPASSGPSGCGGGSLQPRASRVPVDTSAYTDHGDSGAAIYRAARMLNIARGVPLPSVSSAAACGATGAPYRVNLATGNLLAYTRPPAGNGFDPVPTLTYNAKSTVATEYGYGWSGMYGQKVTVVDETTVDVTKGTGTVLEYTSSGGSTYTPPDGAKNSLQQNANGTWTEIQPGKEKGTGVVSIDVPRLGS